MSTQIVSGVGARLRALRGEKTQAEFAALIGITRSALANYEVERTLPKKSLLRKVAEKLGISDSYLLESTFRNQYELNQIVTGEGSINECHESGDELAVIRILRACQADTVRQIVRALLDDIEQNAQSRDQLEASLAPSDIARLGEILKAQGAFEKGGSAAETVAFLASLAKRS